MSAFGNETQVTKQLEQDLQNELNTANQLLRLISVELHKIKNFTRPGGDFEANILKNNSQIKELAKLQQIDLEKLPAFIRKQIDLTNDAELDESQLLRGKTYPTMFVNTQSKSLQNSVKSLIGCSSGDEHTPCQSSSSPSDFNFLTAGTKASTL